MYHKEQLKSVLIEVRKSGKVDPETLGSLTEAEREVVYTLYGENLISEALLFLEELDTEEEWRQFMKKTVDSRKRPVSFIRPVMKYAAVLVSFLALGYFFFQDKDGKSAPIEATAIKLKMGENNVKVLQKGQSQQIVSNAGKVLGVQNGDKITYKVDSEIDELVYNELEIPFGKIFNVELSDGTLIHLNSGTKIKYPVKFLKEGKREVFLEGEAYFKVAKDAKHPFVVHANEVAVEVLGTEFNLTSYDEDAEINTVLVEGSVSMGNSVKPEDHIILTPGTKGTWDKNSHVTNTENVDVGLYTGWVSGEIVFRNTMFSAMQKRLERSYNVSITNYNTMLANKVLNARFNVNIETIDDVMKSIGEIYPLKYEIRDKEVIIQ
ncbi:FecR family protein [Zobellia uliginosa]|uniref:FecR family protein n=1 Tax=Zobellia uliginosa TaxID=143224 RepID=UPI0026E34EBD|nr:FecR domain-containing protein [Zobellia uliginosa]MDO6519886.1 FecR domain-containing protein [Zobellia uliginosa]